MDVSSRSQGRGDLGGLVVFGKGMYDFDTVAGLDAMRQEWLVSKFFNGDRLKFCHVVFGVHDQYELVSQNRERFEIAVYRLKSEEREIHVAVEHFARQSLRGVAKDFHHDIWVKSSIVKNDVRKQIQRGTFVSTDADPAALQRTHL